MGNMLGNTLEKSVRIVGLEHKRGVKEGLKEGLKEGIKESKIGESITFSGEKLENGLVSVGAGIAIGFTLFGLSVMCSARMISKLPCSYITS